MEKLHRVPTAFCFFGIIEILGLDQAFTLARFFWYPKKGPASKYHDSKLIAHTPFVRLLYRS